MEDQSHIRNFSCSFSLPLLDTNTAQFPLGSPVPYSHTYSINIYAERPPYQTIACLYKHKNNSTNSERSTNRFGVFYVIFSILSQIQLQTHEYTNSKVQGMQRQDKTSGAVPHAPIARIRAPVWMTACFLVTGEKNGARWGWLPDSTMCTLERVIKG